jgi:hypothetical protein
MLAAWMPRSRQAEQRAISDYLKSLPDADNPSSYECELTTHAPSENEDDRQLRATTQHDSGGDNEGDLPPDLARSVPPTSGPYAWPPLDEEPPKQVSQPVSVQLNEA